MSRPAPPTSRTVDRQVAAAAIDAFLRAIGRDETELAGTGARVAEMFVDELCSGYAIDGRQLIASASIDASSAVLVAVHDIPIVTTCPHHLVPSIGTADVAFMAKARIVGLGAIAALADAHARRLALQEQIGDSVVADLDAVLGPEWVGCRISLAHACMIARGERAIGTHVETVAFRGAPERRAEAHLALRVGAGGRGSP